MGGSLKPLGGVAPQPRPAPPLARALPSPAPLPRSERRRKATRGGGAWRPPPSSGRDRRDVPCSGGGRQDGVCGEFRGPSKGGDSLRAIPSGIVGRGRRRGGQRRAGSTAGGAGRTWTIRSAATFPRHPVPGFIMCSVFAHLPLGEQLVVK